MKNIHINRYRDTLIALCLLCFFYSIFVYRAYKEPSVTLFGNDSQQMVMNSVFNDLKANGFSYSGLMSNQYVTYEKSKPYFSQFGLQYKIYSAIIRATLERIKIDPYIILGIFRNINALLVAGVLTVLCSIISKKVSFFSGLLLPIFLAVDYWTVQYALNLYWFSFVLFLPLVVAWAELSGKKKPRYWLIYVVIVLRCLNGYEFLTNILLSLLIPIIYLYFVAQPTIDLSHSKAIISKGVKVLVLGLFGFISALTIHFINVLIYSKDLKLTFERVTAPMLYRTQGDVLGLKPSLIDDVRSFSKYLDNPFLSLISFKWIIVITFLLLVLLIIVIKKTEGRIYSKKIVGLAVATAFAFLASLSWNILARGHMRYHLYVNSITFVIPFGITFYILISQFVVETVAWLLRLNSSRDTIKG